VGFPRNLGVAVELESHLRPSKAKPILFVALRFCGRFSSGSSKFTRLSWGCPLLKKSPCTFPHFYITPILQLGFCWFFAARGLPHKTKPMELSSIFKPILCSIIPHPTASPAQCFRRNLLKQHYTCSNGAEEEIVDMLMTSCAGATRAYDRRGWLPIHVACSVGASYHVVKVMLDAFPASVALTTNKGSTPRRCCDMTRNSRDYDRICEMLEKARDEWDADQPVPAKRPSSVRLLV